MAKRAPKEEKPYNPIASALVQRVAGGGVAEKLPEEGREETPPLRVLGGRADEKPSALEVSKRGGREKRVILSWEDELAIDELLSELSKVLRTPVKLSNALRSCVILLRHAEESIRKKAAEAGAMSRPSNNDQAAIAVFEQRLASIIQAGVKGSERL
jgi:hypothetical protein